MNAALISARCAPCGTRPTVNHMRMWRRALPLQHRALDRRCFELASISSGQADPLDSDGEGLLPEEDEQVPGTYMDAMSGNTPLGKAIRGACEELDTLGSLERDTLNEAEALLKSVGYKGSLFTPPPSEGDDDV